MIGCAATHYTATHLNFNTLRLRCNTLRLHDRMRCHTLRCNTLRHHHTETALQHTQTSRTATHLDFTIGCAATHCDTLRHAATDCITFIIRGTRVVTILWICYSLLHRVAVYHSVLQRILLWMCYSHMCVNVLAVTNERATVTCVWMCYSHMRVNVLQSHVCERASSHK